MDIEQITELIRDYEYGQYNLGEQDLTIRCDTENKKIAIDNFYQHGTESKTGTCVELANTLYHALRKSFPKKYVFRATGNEPSHFSHPTSTHTFLLMSNYNLLGQQLQTQNPLHIMELLDTNPLIIDPSFQRVSKYSNLAYDVNRIIHQGVEVAHDNACILYGERAVPLGINDSNELVSLYANLECPEKTGIAIRSEGSWTSKHFPINSSELQTRYINQPKLLRVFNSLKNAKVLPGTNLERKETIIVQ